MITITTEKDLTNHLDAIVDRIQVIESRLDDIKVDQFEQYARHLTKLLHKAFELSDSLDIKDSGSDAYKALDTALAEVNSILIIIAARFTIVHNAKIDIIKHYVLNGTDEITEIARSYGSATPYNLTDRLEHLKIDTTLPTDGNVEDTRIDEFCRSMIDRDYLVAVDTSDLVNRALYLVAKKVKRETQK